MANRPWVIPSDVKVYTEFQSVKERADIKLAVDISRADQYVIGYCNQTFESFVEVPPSIKTAIILLTEVYAYAAVEKAGAYKSESFDDYSYTLADNHAPAIENIDLPSLLDGYVVAKSGIAMKLRKL